MPDKLTQAAILVLLLSRWGARWQGLNLGWRWGAQILQRTRDRRSHRVQPNSLQSKFLVLKFSQNLPGGAGVKTPHFHCNSSWFHPGCKPKITHTVRCSQQKSSPSIRKRWRTGSLGMGVRSGGQGQVLALNSGVYRIWKFRFIRTFAEWKLKTTLSFLLHGSEVPFWVLRNSWRICSFPV